jgi:Kyakuja-Dileera-Zisupton transposase
MDYSLTNALTHNMIGISRVICFYDVNCAYMKKFYDRVANSPFINIARDLEIVPGIGIWHVNGHQDSCFPRYAPLFISGAGWVDGEVIETLWSVLNVPSTSARGMTSPARQELLDFQMNDSNFVKMVRMSLYSLLRVSPMSNLTDSSDSSVSVQKNEESTQISISRSVAIL